MTQVDPVEPTLFLRQNSFSLFRHGVEVWPPFEPTANGKPRLAGCDIHRSQFAADTLGLLLRKEKRSELLLFRGPPVTAAGVLPLNTSYPEFTLSPDGRSIAWFRNNQEVAISAVDTPASPSAVVRAAGVHQALVTTLTLAPFRLTIGIGRLRHDFAIEDGTLRHTFHREALVPKSKPELVAVPPEYDPVRFQCKRQGRVHMLHDRLGQVVLLSHTLKPLVHFLVRRENAAVWAPQAGFLGSSALIGTAETSGAAPALGKLIQDHFDTVP